MGKKNKDHKLSSACDQQSQTIAPQSKQDKAQPNGRPCIPQRATEQLMAVSAPGILNQWNQGQVFPRSPPPPPPFSQSQWPGPFLVANVPPIFQTFTPLGTTYPTWQGVVPGGTFSNIQNSVPNMCYYFGYAFPGPCDPSYCYQLQHPYVHNYPVAPGFSSATPTLHGCSASGEQSSQQGIIKLTSTLSQEYHQLLEAQSSENVQLRSEINKLQAEVSDYKGRVTKLEQEVLSLKPKEEFPSTKHKMGTPPTAVIGFIPSGTEQPRKRGRPPKRPLDLVYALQEPPSGPEDRNPAPIKPLFEIKPPIFEKVVLKKADSVKEIVNHPTTTMVQQQTNGKFSNVVTDVGSNIQTNQSNSLLSAHQDQVHQQYQGLQTCGSRTALASGTIIYVGTIDDFQNVCSKLPRPHDVTIRGRSVTVKYTGNGNHGSTSCIPPQKSARELLDAAHRGLFHGSSVFQLEQGAKVTPGGNSANENDASEELLDATNSESAQDEDEDEEKEVGDDTISIGEAIGVVPKDVGESSMKNDLATSPKDLSPPHIW